MYLSELLDFAHGMDYVLFSCDFFSSLIASTYSLTASDAFKSVCSLYVGSLAYASFLSSPVSLEGIEAL